MKTRSSSRLASDQISNPTSSTNSNPKGRNRRHSKQMIENSNLEEHSPLVVTMADQRTMAEMLLAPTEGYAEAIMVPSILAEQFELKHSLINMMTTDQFFGIEKENLHDHIRWFNKITSTIKYKDVPSSAIKLMLFPLSLAGAVRRTTNLRNEISNFQQWFDESFHKAWDRYKDLFRACPHHGFTELHQLDTFYNALNPAHQDSLNVTACGNLLEKSTQDVLMIIEKNLRDNIQGYVSAGAVNYNQGNPGYRPSSMLIKFDNQGELKAITTRSGLVIDGPTVPTPPQSINLKVDERVEKTFTDPYVAEYTIKVPPPPAQKYNPPSQREYVVHQRDPLHPNIPYPSRMLKQKQQEKDAKMLKALLSNKEKLQELANTPLNENSSAKKLGLPQLILTRMTLELANRAICTLTGIARDVFVPVGKFTFLDDFVIVDYESGPRVPLILGRPFLRTARALIDVHGEEMILRDGDERLTLNMRHGTSSYSNQPQKESINLINVFNNSKGCNVLSEKLLDLDSIKDIHPPLHDNPLSGSTTYFSNPLLEEFADELPPEYDDNLQFDIESEVESDAGNVYDDPFDSKGEKIKESKLLIDELDLLCNFHPPSEYDSFISKDFSRVDALPSTNNENKIFNP
nr:reverse transcriptase domain-containing protein [Tanacetum cinerariifolium]